MSINKKIRRGLCGIAAIALSAGTTISAFAPIVAAVDPDVLSFDSTCALSQSLETADFVCTLGTTNYNMFIGVISSEGQDAGAFVRYGSEEELAKIVRENGHFSFTDSDMVAASYIHVEGDDSGIMAMADGSAYRFSAGNVKLSDVINKTFGIAENDGTGADPSDEVHTNPQSIEVEECTDDACGESIPEIVSVESTDFPDNAAKIRVSGVDYEGEVLDFEAGLYGATSEEVEEFVYGYFEEHEAEYEACDELEDEDEYEACADEIYANLYEAALDKFGMIVAGMFDISLIDDSGNIIDYEGDGITITLTVTEDMMWWADFSAEHFGDEYELKLAHYKHDGTIEFIPYVDNEDGTFTIKVTSLSPFAVGITRASSVTPPSPNTFDGVMTNLAVAFVGLAGIATISFIVRRKVRR